MGKNCASPYSHARTVHLNMVNQESTGTNNDGRKFGELDIRSPLSDNEYQLWVRFYSKLCGRIIRGSEKVIFKVLAPKRSQYFEWAVRKYIARNRSRLPRPIKKNLRFPFKMTLQMLVLDFEAVTLILRRKSLRDLEDRFTKNGRKLTGKFMPSILKTVTKESLAKHQYRIYSDQEYQDEAAIQSEVINTAYTLFSQPPPVRVGEPGSESEPWDRNYPEFTSRARKWRKMFGIRPNDSAAMALWHMFHTIFIVDFVEAVRLGRLQGSKIADKLNYMLAGHISHRQGYGRGRSRKALEDAIEEGLVHKAHKSADDMDDEQQVKYEIPDTSYYDKRDRLEYHMLLQQIYARITDKRDLMALNIYYNVVQDSTLEEEYQRNKSKCQQLGLNSSSAVSKRMQRMVEKYHLQEFNPSGN